MRRQGGDASQRALDTAREVLDAGKLLGIYPEGTRAPDQRLHKGHTGVARLSQRCGVPIIPVGIAGTRAVQPPGCRLMRPFHTVTIRFGPPMSGDPGRSDTDDQTELRALTDQLMSEIARRSGQEYVDHYAGRAGDS
jgi:1-acyl-sn-glycerol-3-phosphate acyltransferase